MRFTLGAHDRRRLTLKRELAKWLSWQMPEGFPSLMSASPGMRALTLDMYVAYLRSPRLPRRGRTSLGPGQARSARLGSKEAVVEASP